MVDRLPRRRLFVPFALAVSAALLTGCSAGSPASTPTPTKSPTFTAVGTVDVPLDLDDAMKSSGGPAQGQPCKVKAAYSDVAEGKVEIKDASGTTVALGELGAGTLQPQKDNTMVLFSRCRLPFTVSDVPVGKFFSVHVGDSSREAQQYSRAELESGVAIEVAKASETNG